LFFCSVQDTIRDNGLNRSVYQLIFPLSEPSMDQAVFLAYDGSINGDWVARYAIQLAAGTDGRLLTLLHIPDSAVSVERLGAKLEEISGACQGLEVELEVHSPPLAGDVYSTLLDAIPAGSDVYCVCGARRTSREKGFLAGTVSQRLLRSRRFNTVAIRVVNPGLLGCPGNVMFPLAGHPRKFQAAMPLLRLLAPCIVKLTLLRVMNVNPLFFRYLSASRARTILNEGTVYIREVAQEIIGEAVPWNFRIDDQVIISDDWAKEILIQAGKAHTGLLLLGASDKFLQSRFYYGNKLEQILRHTPCDVGIYRKI